jgi:hypothetical protein
MVAIAVFLTGCATNQQSSAEKCFSFTSVKNALSYAEGHGYKNDVEVLRDGLVTLEEYRAARSTFEDCMTRVGYEFGPVMTDPIGGLQFISTMNYKGPEKSYDSKSSDRCQDMFDPVEQSYTLVNKQQMDPSLLAAVEDCMTTQGFKYPPSATNVETLMAGKSTEAVLKGPVVRCINEEALRVFPEIPQVGIAY